MKTVLDTWGRIDLLLNNGRYIGPGHMDRLVDTPLDLLDKHLEANVMAPLMLTKLVLPQMLERGHGLVLNMTSDVACRTDPHAARGQRRLGSGLCDLEGRIAPDRRSLATRSREPVWQS